MICLRASKLQIQEKAILTCFEASVLNTRLICRCASKLQIHERTLLTCFEASDTGMRCTKASRSFEHANNMQMCFVTSDTQIQCIKDFPKFQSCKWTVYVYLRRLVEGAVDPWYIQSLETKYNFIFPQTKQSYHHISCNIYSCLSRHAAKLYINQY